MADRSLAFVVRNDTILMIKQRLDFRAFCTLPGGNIQKGEKREETCIRELFEQCNLKGKVERLLTINYKLNGSKEYVYLVSVSDDEQPLKVRNSLVENQVTLSVSFMKFDNLSPRDKAHLYSCGILEVPGFREKIFEKL